MRFATLSLTSRVENEREKGTFYFFLAREWEEIRAATRRGRVIAREDFQKQIEVKVGRRLIGESRGRPRKIRPSSLEKVL